MSANVAGARTRPGCAAYEARTPGTTSFLSHEPGTWPFGPSSCGRGSGVASQRAGSHGSVFGAQTAFASPSRPGINLSRRPADRALVGVHDRDWYRQPPHSRTARDNTGAIILAVVVGALLLAAGARHLLRGNQPTFEGEHRSLIGDTKVSLLPGLPALTIHGSSLYFPHDQWTAYLAPEQVCPGGERTDLPLDQQATTMACLVDYARRERGLQPLTIVALLNGSSVTKADRVVRCRQFAHDACNQDPAADARAAGYQGAFGENLYIADGRWGAPRVALDGWLNSPGHRENLFRPEWRTEGLAVRSLSSFGDYHDAELWVQEFGTG